jgi:hypothetical protein
MKFEVLKPFDVVNGKDKSRPTVGKVYESRDLGITDKSMAEMARGGFVHLEAVNKSAPVPTASK